VVNILKNTNKPKKTVNKQQILENLTPIVNQMAQRLGLTVLEVNFTKESGNYFLRIFIYSADKPISHAECADLTRLLSDKLDESDIIGVPYSLEVSSPGVNRKLKYPIEFEVFKNKEVIIILKARPGNKIKEITKTGILLGLSEDNDRVLVEIDETIETIKLSDVKTIQLEG
jgi:ribosome maturation factor RimP